MNCLRLSVDPGRGVYNYEVLFDPPLDSMNARYKCMQQLTEIIGKAKTFDGNRLRLPFKLASKVTNQLILEPIRDHLLPSSPSLSLHSRPPSPLLFCSNKNQYVSESSLTIRYASLKTFFSVPQELKN